MKSKKISNPVIRLFGSLKLAIFLILGFALILTVTTFYESTYGTQAAQYSIYKTWWFGVFLLLIAMSVTCAALKKRPWKRHQVGFLVTHLGILTLIAGSFVTYFWGVEGNLPLMNGEEKGYIYLGEKEVRVQKPKQGVTLKAPLNVGPYVYEEDLITLSPAANTQVIVDRYLPFARRQEETLEANGEGVPALLLKVSNPFVNFEQWMMMNEQGYQEIQMGPAKVVFRKLNSPKDLRTFLRPAKKKKNLLGHVQLTSPEREWKIPLYKHQLNQTIKVKGSPFRLEGFSYFTDARVENSKLVNRSETLNNPAIELTLVGPLGSERHVAFSLFPEFPSTHQKSSLYDTKIQFISHGIGATGTRRLQLGMTQDHQLYYHVSSSKGDRSGKIDVGKKYATGWMNLEFKIKKLYWHATQRVTYHPMTVRDPNNPRVPTAARFRIVRDGKTLHQEWIEYFESRQVALNGEEFIVSFIPKLMPLGFTIHLKEFQMGTDPGTNNPAAYQSDVILKDSSLTDTSVRPHLISMNEPLTHKSFTFYQSSYQNGPDGKPIGSILSVAYDPGRVTKYGGSLFIVLGIFLMFFYRRAYMKAFAERKQKRVMEPKVLVGEVSHGA